MTERKSVDLTAIEETPPDICQWCLDTISSGCLTAIPEDDPMPVGPPAPVKPVTWRLCYKCGWHFHGGKGASGDYHFAPDTFPPEPPSELERALLEDEKYEEYDDGS